MDRTLSWLATVHGADPVERALTEVDTAIALVALGVAVTVQLCNLEGAEAAAFDAAVRAQTAGVAFSLKRNGSGPVTMVVGPVLDVAAPG